MKTYKLEELEMAKYYATGTKTVKQMVNGEKVTNVVNVVIDNLSDVRVIAVNQAERQAKKEKITLDGIHMVKGSHNTDRTLTKEAKKRKALRGGNKKK